ncbi:hypothetical protein CC78DRAFT_608248 [Lojkania enalia]|uniref:Uncharacterized protein n=1 Tax=Lojkania enalia TaxID=147567 RepID=A0A9P4K3J1_9PLEO|nr:hypothetical protein CC78DRAFT_608248 [Didymosphaeria enalia]
MSKDSAFQSFSTTSYSSNINGQRSAYTESTYSDPRGTKVHRTAQEPGQVPQEERLQYDSAGRVIQGGGSGVERRIEGSRVEEVGEDEGKREYEERMAEEYAKREGGA